jgi:hypothetical protein
LRHGIGFAASAAIIGGALSGCSEGAPDIPSIQQLEGVQVACANVDGFLPLDQAACDQAAQTVQRGLELLTSQTNGKIKTPKVSGLLLKETVHVDDALSKRCLSIDNAGNRSKVADLFNTIAADATHQSKLDLTKNGLEVMVNAPATNCPNVRQLPKVNYNLASCTEVPGGIPAGSVANGRALQESGRPVVFMFADDLSGEGSAHEWLHLHTKGNKDVGLGHEQSLCQKNSPALSHDIKENKPLVFSDFQSDSIMDPRGDGRYIAPPQQLALGTVGEDRIVTPEVSGTFDLNGLSRQGAFLLRLPLKNNSIREVLSKEHLPVDDYRLFTAIKPGGQEVVTYAAPDIGKQEGSSPIFNLNRSRPGETFAVQGGFTLQVLMAGPDRATIDLRLER